jgi:lysophospholipase L1-like esterase
MKRSIFGLLLVVLALAAVAAPLKKKRKPAAPKITAAQRAAAQQEIARRIQAAGTGFENSGALASFYQALRSGQPVHILQFGDSHTASDDWVNSMRTLLQAKYGDGGPGFVPAGRPFKGFRRFDAQSTSSLGWQTEGTMAHLGDPEQGLSGLSISTHLAGQSVGLGAAGEALSVFYLQQPGGGQVELTADGQSMGVFSTDGATGPGVASYTLLPGPHELSLRTLDHAPVRLFGWVLDKKQGLTFETLGINGAQAHVILGWDEAIWAAEVAARNPALVILAYGTNEANSHRWELEQYRADLTALLDRVRRAAPKASILMIGPPDCGRIPLLHLADVVAAERAFAREQNVAFWDWRAHMGGPGSVKLWYTAGYGQSDYIHMTGEGYRMIGGLIADALQEVGTQNEQAAKDR